MTGKPKFESDGATGPTTDGDKAPDEQPIAIEEPIEDGDADGQPI